MCEACFSESLNPGDLMEAAGPQKHTWLLRWRRKLDLALLGRHLPVLALAGVHFGRGSRGNDARDDGPVQLERRLLKRSGRKDVSTGRHAEPFNPHRTLKGGSRMM